MPNNGFKGLTDPNNYCYTGFLTHKILDTSKVQNSFLFIITVCGDVVSVSLKLSVELVTVNAALEL